MRRYAKRIVTLSRTYYFVAAVVASLLSDGAIALKSVGTSLIQNGPAILNSNGRITSKIVLAAEVNQSLVICNAYVTDTGALASTR